MPQCLDRVFIICQQCKQGLYIYPYEVGRRKFCSRKCRNDFGNSRAIIKKCPTCQKSFRATPVNQKQTYCSKKCITWPSPPKKVAIRKCPTCNKEFTVPASETKRIYCSRVCANTHNKIPAEPQQCIHCGKWFTPDAWKRGQQKFCTHKCYMNSKTIKPRVCLQCNREYMPGHPKQIFCSNECHHLGQMQRVPIKCKNCGKEFFTTTYISKEAKYCSQKCYYQNMCHSLEEKRIISIIESILKQPVVYQHTFPWLKSFTGRPMYIDGFFPSLNIAVEYDGKQHRVYMPRYHTNKQAFKNLQRRDKLKDRLLKKHGITLIRIADNEPGTEACIRNKLVPFMPLLILQEVPTPPPADDK